MIEILEFIKSNENGVTEDILCSKYNKLTKLDLAKILNGFLQQNLIEIYKDGSKIYYRPVYNKTSDYESMIFSLISKSGTTGLWLKDIKTKTNVPHNLVLKILKFLEDTRKIKSIKSIKNNRKTYILYDVQPAEDISGGIWFSNNDVDSVFVNKLMDIIHHFVSRKEEPFVLCKIENLVSFNALREYIVKSRISEVDISEQDLNTLIDCMVFDGRIERLEYENICVLRALPIDYLKF